jgi:NTP pyrophosphatase (non-canonical NTP hydrolase)
MDLGDLQDVIARTYLDRDRARGADGTFRWLVEEVGELARALRDQDPAALAHELGDVLAWTTSVANLVGVSLDEAVERYAHGCPKCGASPCRCPMR